MSIIEQITDRDRLNRMLDVRRLKPEQFADLIGHGRSTVYTWVNGAARTPGSIGLIADLLMARPEILQWMRERYIEGGK